MKIVQSLSQQKCLNSRDMFTKVCQICCIGILCIKSQCVCFFELYFSLGCFYCTKVITGSPEVKYHGETQDQTGALSVLYTCSHDRPVASSVDKNSSLDILPLRGWSHDSVSLEQCQNVSKYFCHTFTSFFNTNIFALLKGE